MDLTQTTAHLCSILENPKSTSIEKAISLSLLSIPVITELKKQVDDLENLLDKLTIAFAPHLEKENISKRIEYIADSMEFIKAEQHPSESKESRMM